MSMKNAMADREEKAHRPKTPRPFAHVRTDTELLDALEAEARRVFSTQQQGITIWASDDSPPVINWPTVWVNDPLTLREALDATLPEVRK